jgi:hypothetical protein
MRAIREQPPVTVWLVVALTVATLAMCVWIALTVNLGAAVIGMLGVAAAVWLFVSSTGGPPQPIPVFVRRHRR